ncbi:hypothetical protein ACFOMH_07520 [Paracoccus mangrovi]|uniref:Uncharacterized protein n=1 Tax=Paracoccus mangrovi TaxID=1715645 RepID=A0ABV7R149_9RHOB
MRIVVGIPIGAQDSLEAGTGIEPVFTDLQSNSLSFYLNSLVIKEYQDIGRTADEHDTATFHANSGGRGPCKMQGWPQ